MNARRARARRYATSQFSAKQAFAFRDDIAAPRRRWRSGDADAMDILEVIQAICENPDIYEIAATLGARDPLLPGRPADYPHWAMFIFGSLISAYGSANRVHAALRMQRNWEWALQNIAATIGQDVVDGLSEKARRQGPKRNHWNYWLRRYAHTWEPCQETYLPLAVKQARDQGCLRLDVRLNVNMPRQENTVYGDGKACTSPSGCPAVDKRTGEMFAGSTRKRIDPASAFWIQGGEDGTDVYGPKLVNSAVRGPGYGNKVLLLVDQQVKGGKSEADIAVDQIRRIAEVAGAGLHAAVYDGAFTGKHIGPLMRELGLVVVSPVKAYRNPERVRSGRKSSTRVEKERRYDTYRCAGSHAPCEHELVCRGGRLGESVLDATGKRSWRPLVIDALERRANKNTYRWYQRVTIPCDTNGDHSYRVTLHETDEDKITQFNRGEYLRQLPPDTEGYKRMYGRRSAAESDNSQREQRYVGHRMPAYGLPRQGMIMFGFNLLENSKARWRQKHREPDATIQA